MATNRKTAAAIAAARAWLVSKLRLGELDAELARQKTATITAMAAAGVTTVDVELATGDIYAVTAVAGERVAVNTDALKSMLTPHQKSLVFPRTVTVTHPFNEPALLELIRTGKIDGAKVPRTSTPIAPYLKPTIKQNPKAAAG